MHSCGCAATLGGSTPERTGSAADEGTGACRPDSSVHSPAPPNWLAAWCKCMAGPSACMACLIREPALLERPLRRSLRSHRCQPQLCQDLHVPPLQAFSLPQATGPSSSSGARSPLTRVCEDKEDPTHANTLQRMPAIRGFHTKSNVEFVKLNVL